MTTINLKDYFYWYTENVYIEVSDEIARELRSEKDSDRVHWRRMKRNKSNYSLDADDGIENAICKTKPSPEECVELMERYRRLCCALNALPPIQGRRVYAYFMLGLTHREIAAAEGVCKKAVGEAIRRGLDTMREYMQRNI